MHAAPATLVVLVGPKGAGKTWLGRLLEDEGLAGFLDVEPLVLLALQQSRSDGVPWTDQGFTAIARALGERLAHGTAVAIELAGASPLAPDFVASLRSRARVVLVRVDASEETCRQRLARRGGAGHVPTSPDLAARINEASRALAWSWDATIVNEDLGEAEARDRLRGLARLWTTP